MRPVATAFVVVAVAVTGATAFLAFQAQRSGSIAFWALAAGPAIVLGAIAAAWAVREDLLREWLTPTWGDFTRGVLGAIALFAAAWVLVHFVASAGSPRVVWIVSIYGQIGDPHLLQAHASALAAGIGVTVIAEEVLWRGMVTQLFAQRFGSRTAWIWAAVAYAAAYVPTMWSLRADAGLDPLMPIAALGAGLVWGAMARTFGRLAPGIVAHALFDWAVVMMFPLWGPR